jgi:hypothetical protein
LSQTEECDVLEARLNALTDSVTQTKLKLDANAARQAICKERNDKIASEMQGLIEDTASVRLHSLIA